MNWWVRPFRRTVADRQLDSELQFHLEQQIRDYIASGVPPQEARRRARLEFGGLDQVKEQVHDAHRGHLLETLVQDLRYGLRTLRKDIGFTSIAVLTLALGIGANTAIFSLVDGVLLQPLPYRDASRLVGIDHATYPKGAFAAMREQIHTMDVATYFDGQQFNLTGMGEPVRLNVTSVSANFFSVLRVQAQSGRTFAPGEDLSGRDGYVILSHALWEKRFSGDRSVIGRAISIGGVSRQITGIMPADFRFPSAATDVWIPLGIDPRNVTDYWAQDYMPVIGRLKPGSTIAEAGAEVRLFQSHVRRLFPWPMPKNWNAGLSVVPLQSVLVGDVRAWLLILLGAVALVLLIACANVANLTLSRASTRTKEIAVRASLGAGRQRILRQLITESVVLAFAGGVLGIALAIGALSTLRSSFPVDTPGMASISIDWRVLAFTAGLAFLAGIVSGLVPALHSSRTDLTQALKSTGRGVAGGGSRQARRALVVGEVALAVLLVSSAGLLIRSLWVVTHANPGFGAAHLLTARIAPNDSYCDEAGRCVEFYREIVARVRALPGVTGAAVINTLPLDGRVNKRSVLLEGTKDTQVLPLVWQNIVSPDYFQTMGIHLLQGRGLSEADSTGDLAVAIVSGSTARRLWPNGGAIGKHIQLADTGDTGWITIVGVVADVRAYSLQQNVPGWIDGTIYMPYGPKATMENKRIPADMTLVVRTSQDEGGLADSVRGVVSGLNAESAVSDVKTMTGVIADVTSGSRSVTSLFASFAIVAFVLGATGIYGVISFFVGQRTREIGIRIALGAQKTQVLKIVVAEGLSVTFAGVVSGLLGAVAVRSLLRSFLYGVSPTDPAVLSAVAFLFALVALGACYIPARRAMRVDPVATLRGE